MATSSIKITFNQDLQPGEAVHFRRRYDDGSLSGPWMLISETWLAWRFTSGQIGVGVPTGVPGERSAIDYANYVWLDHLWPISTGILGITQIGNEVTIRMATAWQFDLNSLPTPNTNNVTIEINNFSVNNPFFNITDESIIPAEDNPTCTHYRVAVTTSQLATEYTVNGVTTTGNTDNPFFFELPRAQGGLYSCSDGNGQTAKGGITFFEAPELFNSATINLTISGSPFGATMVASVLMSTFSSLIPLEYSLDNTNWQTSNTFSGLVNGDYTLYVRDALGCTQTRTFNINPNNVVNPEFEISKSLSFRFSKVQELGDCGPYRNDENSMSCKEFSKDPSLAYQETQLFQTCDNIITQFKSNYSNLVAKVAKPDGSEDTLIINQMTNNIGRKDARDAWRYSVGFGQTGIYFTSGNIYDYDTDADTGDDFSLNGGLPEWGRIGEYLSIGTTWHEIINVIYDETLNAEVLVVDGNFTGSSPEAIIVKCQFNRQKYEVYEFVTSMALYNNMKIQVQIFNTDPNFEEDEIWASELIHIKERHSNTVEVIYWNKSNTDIFYRTGIRNKLRLRIVDIIGDHKADSEALASDNKSSLIKASLYELNEFLFEPTSKGMYWKILQAMMHKYVLIDGVGYHIDDKPDKENGPIGDSNQYQVKAKMIKTNEPYTAHVIGTEPEIVTSDGTLEVPNLIIKDNGEFVSY